MLIESARRLKMKLQVLFALGAVFFVGVCAPAVKADSYSSVTTTTQESLPVSDVTGSYTTTVEAVPTPVTVIREQPVIISQPASPEIVVVKEHRHHHLINLGLVKVF